MRGFLAFLCYLLVSYSTFGAEVPTQDLKNFGWLNRPEEVKIVDLATRTHKEQLTNLVKFNDDQAALNYRFLFRALNDSKQLSQTERASGRLDSLSQGRVGSCVGYATTQALDIIAAANVYARPEANEAWNVRFNPDAIYGIGRYENLGGWDGSTGAWSINGLRKYGTLHRLVYGNYDLRNTRPEDGRGWARTGVPGDLLSHAVDHKAVASAKITSVEEAKAALQNGYSLIVCAQASYSSTRDSDGFSKLTGRAWAHAMAVIAYRGAQSGREGYLIWNSWGNTWNSGGTYPSDQPHGSFWVTPRELKYHVDQGDSWAIAGYEGFKFRKITWSEVFDIGQEIK